MERRRLNHMRRILPLILLIVSFFSFAGPAHGCSCAMVDPKGMLEFAPTAFVGTVTGAPAVAGGGGGSVVFTLKSKRSWPVRSRPSST